MKGSQRGTSAKNDILSFRSDVYEALKVPVMRLIFITYFSLEKSASKLLNNHIARFEILLYTRIC